MIFLSLSSVATMGFPYLLGNLLESHETSVSNPFEWTNLNNINVLLLLMLFVFVAISVLGFFRIYFSSYFAENTLTTIRKEAFKKLSFSTVSFYDKNQVGELSSRIATDISMLQELLVTTLAEFIRQWITIVIGISVILFISPKLKVSILAIVQVVIVLIIVFGKKIRKLSKNAQDAAAESNSILSETLSGIKNVKSFGNEFFEMARYGKKADSIQSLSIKGAIARGLFASFIIFGLFGSITFVVYQGHAMTLSGELSDKDFYIFILFY